MTYAEAKDIISRLNENQEFTEENKKTINDIHLIIYKCDVADCNCSSKYKDAVIKMMIWFRHNTAFNTCHYVMQRGEAFMVGLTYYNNSNLTDEIAEKLIETNERAKKVISKVSIDVEASSSASTSAESEEVVVRKKSRRK